MGVKQLRSSLALPGADQPGRRANQRKRAGYRISGPGFRDLQQITRASRGALWLALCVVNPTRNPVPGRLPLECKHHFLRAFPQRTAADLCERAMVAIDRQKMVP